MNAMTLSCKHVQFKGGCAVQVRQNINEGLFKVKYLIKLRQYFGNLAKPVMRSYNKKFLNKVSKILAQNNEVFNF